MNKLKTSKYTQKYLDNHTAVVSQMIIAKAPMRISFVGGGSDITNYYSKYTGKVISAAIDKYVYIVINHAPLIKGVHARYSIIEAVENASELKNTRIREVMLHLKVAEDVEIGTFSHLKAGVGLGGSSSFTVALLKAFSTFKKLKYNKRQIAEIACKVEIDKLKEPIGKQDQYAVSLGGINTLYFAKNGKVTSKPLHITKAEMHNFQKHVLMFFTGITRSASVILSEQKKNRHNNHKEIKKMTELVEPFEKALLKGDYTTLGRLMHKNWLYKKRLAKTISNNKIDKLYQLALKNGAYGGKLAGAGGGGCLIFIINPQKRNSLIRKLEIKAEKLDMKNFHEVPFNFVAKGVEITKF